MKRSLNILFACAALLLSSCLGDQKVNTSPVVEGQILYNVLSTQNFLSTDPATIAFRLNILLETAAAKQVAPEEVTIKLGEVEKNLKQLFFGGNEVMQANENLWDINFSYSAAAEADKGSISRGGQISIATGGKTLGELAPGESWTISVGANGYRLTSGQSEVQSLFSSYTIQATGNNTWEIFGNSRALVPDVSGSSADWDFDFTVTQSGTGGLTWDEVMASTYLMSGGASGYAIGQGTVTFYYDIRDDAALKYRPSCNHDNPLGGAEVVSIDVLAAAELGLKSNEVKYLWGETSQGSCIPTYTVSYNGYTYDPADDTTSEEENPFN